MKLLERPFARGREEQEQDMALVDFPLPTAADESCLHLAAAMCPASVIKLTLETGEVVDADSEIIKAYLELGRKA